MSQIFVKYYVHVIFSTKHRVDLIAPAIETELFSRMSGILKKKESSLLAANGASNHVHLLISPSINVSLCDLIRELKKSTSRWVKTNGPAFKDFQWQNGYGAFTVCESDVPALEDYIAWQKEKHKVKSFEDEYIDFLNENDIKYDERYLWG
jgi:putative transposase